MTEDGGDGLRRWALGVEYDGSGFAGFQDQGARPSVQSALEAALAAVAAHPVRVVAAGRTDAGVHAREQVVHCDLGPRRDAEAWVRGTNAHLPDGVIVRWACPVPDDFDARRSARSRRYLYRVLNRPEPTALLARRTAWLRDPLDVRAMRRGARVLLGRHDFAAFRAASCEARTTVRTLRRLAILRRGPEVWFDVEADAFLQRMVRNLVGSLLEVGRRRRPGGWLAEVLASGDRTRAGPTAPAQGLVLLAVRYPRRYRLPQRPWDGRRADPLS
ncbi:MAG: tRNA pseudouridine(38-40) synthase TruA [Gammaproteobacteria bacterium]|nr:tRNA pseudouridine(38-40) synthase TruA [Gammaproteobacteria bacterium]